MQFVLDVLNKNRCLTECNCESCKKRKLAYGPYNCNICGYSGSPITLQSESIAYSDTHGKFACPACNNGEANPWTIIKELRKRIEVENLICTVSKKERRYVVTGDAIVDVGPCETEDCC